MDLSIIIVSWKVKERMRENLKSIFSSTGQIVFEVFVVDNNSSDGSAEMVAAEFPQVILIANQNNLGFARAVNQAINRSSGQFILLLNPDMLLQPDTLINSLKWAQAKPSAVVSGIHLQTRAGDSVPQVRRFPGFFDQLAVVLKLSHFWPTILKRYLYQDFNYQLAAKVDSIRGSYFLINCAAWQKISGQNRPFLDERYFIWFEEVDFCRQVYENKGEVWYTPAAKAYDDIGRSFVQVKIKQKQEYFCDSMLVYFKKWQPTWQYLCLKLAWHFIFILLNIREKFIKQ